MLIEDNTPAAPRRRHTPGKPVPGMPGTLVRYVRVIGGHGLAVEVVDAFGSTTYTLDELNREADAHPHGRADRILSAVTSRGAL